MIESLAESISQLTSYVLSLAEVNADPPPNLPENGANVTKVAGILVQVAHQTAQAFKDYPNVQSEIDAEADKVGVFTQNLGDALNNIVVAADRAEGYKTLLDACKQIATGTAYLLVLVYGARTKAILIKAQQAKASVHSYREHATNDAPSNELVTGVQDITNEMGYLAALVAAAAKEATDEDDKAMLAGHSAKIAGSRQTSINQANGWIQAPADDAAHAAVTQDCDDVEALIDALIADLTRDADMDANAQLLAIFQGAENAQMEKDRAGKANADAARDLGALGRQGDAAAGQVSENEQPLMAAAAELGKSASTLVGDLKPEPEKFDANSDDFKAKRDAFRDAGANAIAGEDDDTRRAGIESGVAAVDAAGARLETATAASAADPTSEEANTEVEEAAKELRDALDALIRDAIKREQDAERTRREAAAEAARAAAAERAAREADAHAATGPSAASARDLANRQNGNQAASEVLDAAAKLLQDADVSVTDAHHNPAAVPADVAQMETDTADFNAKGAVLVADSNDSAKDPLSAAIANVASAADAHNAAATAAASPEGQSSPEAAAGLTDATTNLASAVDALGSEMEKQRAEAAKRGLDAAAAAAEAEASSEPEGTPLGSFLASGAELGNIAPSAVDAAVAGDADSAKEAGDAIRDTVAAVTASAKEAAADADTPEERKAIVAASAKVSTAGNKLADASAKAGAATPGSAEHTKALGAVNTAAEELAAGLNDLAHAGSDKHFREARDALEHARERAAAAADDATQHHERSLLNSAATIAGDSGKILDESHGASSPETAAQLEADTKALNKEVVAFVTAGKAAAAEVTDPEEQSKLKHNVKAVAKDAALVLKAQGNAVAASAKAESLPGTEGEGDVLAAKNAVNTRMKDLAAAIEQMAADAEAKRQAEAIRRATKARNIGHGDELLGLRDAIKQTAASGDTAAAGNSAGAMREAIEELADISPDYQRKAALRDAAAKMGTAGASGDAAAMASAADEALAAAATDAAAADLVDEAAKANAAADAAGTGTPVGALLDAARDVAKAGANLATDAKANPDAVPADVTKLDGANDVLAAAGEAAMAALADGADPAVVADDLIMIKAASDALAESAQALAAGGNPDDLAANEDVLRKGIALQEAVDKLVNDVRPKKTALEELNDNVDDLLAALDKLEGCVDRKDGSGADPATSSVVEAAKVLGVNLEDLGLPEQAAAVGEGSAAVLTTSTPWQADVNDADKTGALKDAIAQLRGAANEARRAGMAEAAARDFDATGTHADELAGEGDFSGEELILLEAIKATSDSAKTLVGDVAGNPGAVDGDAQDLDGKVDNLGTAVENVLATLDNAGDKARLNNSMPVVRSAAAGLATAAKAAAANPDDSEAAQQTSAMAKALNDALEAMIRDARERALHAAEDAEAASAAKLAGMGDAAETLKNGATPEQLILLDATAKTAGEASGLIADHASGPAGLNGAMAELETASGPVAASGDADAKTEVPRVVGGAKEAATGLAAAAEASAAAPGSVAAAQESAGAADNMATSLGDVLGEIAREQRASAAADLRSEAAASREAAPLVSAADGPLMEANGELGDAAAALLDGISADPANIDTLVSDVSRAAAASTAANSDGKSPVGDAASALVTAAKRQAMSPGSTDAAAAVVGAARDLAGALAAERESRKAAQEEALAASLDALKGKLNDAAAAIGTEPASALAGVAGTALDGSAGDGAVGAAATALGEDLKANSGPGADADPRLLSLLGELDAAAAALDGASTPAERESAGTDLATAMEGVAGWKHQRELDETSDAINAALFDLAGFDIEGLGDLLGIAGDLGRAMGDMCGKLPGMNQGEANEASDGIEELKDNLKAESRMVQLEKVKDKELKNIIADAVRDMAKAAAQEAASGREQDVPGANKAGGKMAKALEKLASDLAAWRAKNEGGGNEDAADVISGIAANLKDHMSQFSGAQADDSAVVVGNELAELMEQLAKAAKAGKAQDIIAVARRICELSKTFAKEAIKTGKACPDARLKQTLVDAASALGTFATQLKVLASVKAANAQQGIRDQSAEDSLIAVCLGLQKSALASVDGAVSARLVK